MVSREFPSIVTGHSHSVDVIAKRDICLLLPGSADNFSSTTAFAPKREEMKKLAALTLSLVLTTGAALADTQKEATPQTAKTARIAKPKAVAKKVDKSAEITAQLEEFRKALQSQQERIQHLENELAKRDQQIGDRKSTRLNSSHRH